MNATVGAVVGSLGATMAGPYLASGTLKAGLVKTGVSAVSQMVINKQVNLVGAAADGFLIPGAGDFIGASFDVGYSVDNRWYSRTVLGNKNFNDAAREGLISTFFSIKIHGLDGLVPNASSLGQSLYQMPNYLASYGAQKGIQN